jgi:hypothetical protein
MIPGGLGWLVAGFAFGAPLAPWSVRRGRRGVAPPAALVQWEERVVPAWLQDRAAATFMGLHGSTLLLLAVLATIDALRAPAPALPVFPAYVLLGVIAGAVAGFPLAGRFGRRMPMALYPAGIVRGRFASEWGAYSHFVCDPAAGWGIQGRGGTARSSSPGCAATAPAVASPPRSLSGRGRAAQPGRLAGRVRPAARRGAMGAVAFAGTAYAVCLGGIGLVRGFALD